MADQQRKCSFMSCLGVSTIWGVLVRRSSEHNYLFLQQVIIYRYLPLPSEVWRSGTTSPEISNVVRAPGLEPLSYLSLSFEFHMNTVCSTPDSASQRLTAAQTHGNWGQYIQTSYSTLTTISSISLSSWRTNVRCCEIVKTHPVGDNAALSCHFITRFSQSWLAPTPLNLIVVPPFRV